MPAKTPDPLEIAISVEALQGKTTKQLPDGRIISLADALWGELSAEWSPAEGAADPFLSMRGRRSAINGTCCLGRGQEAQIYALRARTSSQEAYDWLSGDEGRDVTVAVHYNARVYRERPLNLLLREDLLFGTPMVIREMLTFGMFVIPEPSFAVPEGLGFDYSAITFSLVGYISGEGERAAKSDRFAELNTALVTARARKASDGPYR